MKYLWILLFPLLLFGDNRFYPRHEIDLIDDYYTHTMESLDEIKGAIQEMDQNMIDVKQHLNYMEANMKLFIDYYFNGKPIE